MDGERKEKQRRKKEKKKRAMYLYDPIISKLSDI
jgi:hypothetical protein